MSPSFVVNSRKQFRFGLYSLPLAIVFAVLEFVFKISAITGLPLAASFDLNAAVDVLFGTRYGTVWTIRLALACPLAALFLLEMAERKKSDSISLNSVGLILSAFFLMTLAFAGHASATEGMTLVVQVAVDAFHLLAAGVWLGGLVYLAVLFHWIKRRDDPLILIIAQEATRRFSRLGFLCVSLLIGTGLFNASYLVNGVSPLFGTPYGWLLLAKMVLLIPLIGLAAINFLGLKPKLLSLSPPLDRNKMPNLLSRMKRNVVAEASFGAAILLIVGNLAITPPARHVQPDWPFPFRLNWNVTARTAPNARSQINTAIAVGLAGLFALSAALVVRRRRGWILGAGIIFIGVGVILAAFAVSIDAYPTAYRRPSVPYQAISIANGMALYRDSCAVCHGTRGYGDGPAAQDLKSKPADLTARHAADHTAGDLYWWLTHGVKDTAMPGYRLSLSEEERWDLINYLRALSSAERARSLAPVVESEPSLVAPDFAYGNHRGEARTLKEHRGRGIVLLVLFTLPGSRQRLEQLDAIYTRFQTTEVEILLVPATVEPPPKNEWTSVRQASIITEGSQEIFETYSLFSYSLDVDRSSAEGQNPRHTEFLIDKQGYIRARWLQRESTAWSKIESLMGEIAILIDEKSRAPAPDDHVH